MHIPVYIDKNGSTGESGMPHEKYGATPGANMYNSDRQDGRTVIIGGSGIGSDMWFGWLEYHGTTPGARTYNYDIQDGRCVMIGGYGNSTDEWFEWQVYHGIFSP